MIAQNWLELHMGGMMQHGKSLHLLIYQLANDLALTGVRKKTCLHHLSWWTLVIASSPTASAKSAGINPLPLSRWTGYY